MNNLLQKCVKELKAEKPDLSYIRGILETLIEIEGKDSIKLLSPDEEAFQMLENGFPTSYTQKPHDEASLLDAQAKTMIAQIPPQSQEI